MLLPSECRCGSDDTSGDVMMHPSAPDSHTMLFAYAWTVHKVCGGWQTPQLRCCCVR